MGHLAGTDRRYRLLQQQLDRMVTGAPDSPAFGKILRILFSPDDAELARKMPLKLVLLGELSAKLGIPRVELGDRLTDMAQRGLVIDLQHAGQHYFTLAPVVIGFFEFTFMRARDELPIAELARLFDEYLHADDRFVLSATRGQTQLGRSLVHEEALPPEDHVEILDWERASHVVKSASAVGVSICACRHKASHLGQACDRLQDCCLTLNYAADSMIRNGMARPVTVDEAMRILEDCKRAGLAQIADNVRRKVTFICNCCGCCCEFMQAVKTYKLPHGVTTSNWIMEVDTARCEGCGACVEACPVDAITMTEQPDGDEPCPTAARDATVCLGCGVCYSSCPYGAISMNPRARRIFTPETVFDRIVTMAVERGRLAEMLFDDPERLSHRALGRIVGVIEKSPFFKAAMAIKPLQSAFLRSVVAGAKRKTGRLREILE